MSGLSDIDVSRSGRVRKKSSLLADYESLDNYDKPIKPAKKSKSPGGFRRNFLDSGEAPGRVTLKFEGREDYGMMKPKKRPSPKKIKYEPIEVEIQDDFRPDLDMMLNEVGDGDLEMDLPLEYDDSEIPILGAEEIIDEELLDAEDGATEITTLNSISRIKSQAESTYMMEKSSKKGQPGTFNNVSPHGSISAIGTAGPRLKVKKKKKGSPRATAYVLWAKEYRTQLANKYPHMDFASISKKLGELWATVPDNQKKMWKLRAAKDSRKGENIKNSAAPKPAKARQRKKPPAVLPQTATGHEIYEKAECPVPIRRGGGGGKTQKSNSRKSRGNETAGSSSSSSNSRLEYDSSINSSNALVIKSEKRVSPGKRSGKNKNLDVSSLSRSFQSGFNLGPGTSMSSQYLLKKEEEIPSYKETSTTPVDVAAHFSVLGESLSIIGDRLKEHEGPNISGSLSVLLDSFLCATGPLLCLTQQVPELNHIPPDDLSKMLDNIAYLMPGL